jgi:Tol biopolymer transport system component
MIFHGFRILFWEGTLVGLSLVLIGCAASFGQIAQSSESGDLYPREIVFTSRQGSNWEVFRIRTDTGRLTRLTHTLLEEEAASPSFDGEKVAFVSKRDGDYEIYVMNLDGKGQQRLTFSDGVDEKPTWVRGASKILFESARDGNWEIYIMDVDGHNQLNLTQTKADEADPVLSPGGERVLFKSMRDGAWRLYLMDLDGARVIPLESSTYQEGALDDPVWSPDGNEFVFVSHEDGNAELYKASFGEYDDLKHPVGIVNLKRLTNHPAADESPVWSPDGRRILFVSDRNGSRRVHVMDPDGSYRGLLSPVPILGGGLPRWSEDGAWVAYAAKGGLGPGIQVVNARDGRHFWIEIDADEISDLEWVPAMWPYSSDFVCVGDSSGTCVREAIDTGEGRVLNGDNHHG